MKAAKDTVPAPVTQLSECLLGHSLLGWLDGVFIDINSFEAVT